MNFDIATFNELYDECIDENGNVKACGRVACMTLIRYANGHPSAKSVPYGDETTGRMNVANLVKLHTDVNK